MYVQEFVRLKYFVWHKHNWKQDPKLSINPVWCWEGLKYAMHDRSRLLLPRYSLDWPICGARCMQIRSRDVEWTISWLPFYAPCLLRHNLRQCKQATARHGKYTLKCSKREDGWMGQNEKANRRRRQLTPLLLDHKEIVGVECPKLIGWAGGLLLMLRAGKVALVYI